jgi:hypothetical protein
MSDHGHLHELTREEVLVGTQRPVSRRIKMLCAAMAILGTIVFLCGALTGVDRAWQALHFNWLFLKDLWRSYPLRSSCCW